MFGRRCSGFGHPVVSLAVILLFHFANSGVNIETFMMPLPWIRRLSVFVSHTCFVLGAKPKNSIDVFIF